MNRKGFAITAVLYGLLIVFVVLVSSYLYVMNARKSRLDKIIEETEEDYYKKLEENTNGGNETGNDQGQSGMYITVDILDDRDGTLFRIYYYNAAWYESTAFDREITTVSCPTRDSYTFLGYYTSKSCGGTKIINGVSDGCTINEKVVPSNALYPCWERTSVGGGGSQRE